ncbi:hypothetical protein Q1695_005647 [Nippostrongylus brasiliensis]|nr:hypothetical protein Q1695_005647 [Nippostrongylus brasiliensis]
MRLAFILQCLAQIYCLICNGQQSTKRDLYYEYKKLYGSQSVLDRAIKAICDLLDESRSALRINSSGKGLLTGALTFITSEQRLIDCREQQVLISESLMSYRVVSDAQFILVVEKDAIFQKMLDEGYFTVLPASVIVTGKGYPDICTRLVLRWLVGREKEVCLGIEIMLTYKYGSMSDCKEGRGCFVKEMQWLGFKPSDASVLPIMSHQFIGLYNRDFVKITRIRRRAERLREYDVVKELDLLRSMRCKLELEAVSSIAPQFIINGYLLYRLPAPVPVCYRSPNQALVDEQLEASTVVICGNH